MKGQFELFYQLVGNNGMLFNATDIFDTYVYRITTTQPLSMGLGTAAGLFQPSKLQKILIQFLNDFLKNKNLYLLKVFPLYNVGKRRKEQSTLTRFYKA